VLGSKTGRSIGTILLFVGAVLLIAALIEPWYADAASNSGLPGGGTRNVTVTYYPGISSLNGTIRYSCGGSGFEGSLPCPDQTSYSNAKANSTGIVAETGFLLGVVAVVSGILAALLGMASRRNSRRGSSGLAFAVVALAFAILAPVVFGVALPTAVGKDTPGHRGNGPWSSFFGSASSTIFPVRETTTWGPSLGWYMSIAAAGLFLVGVIFFARLRVEPLQPVAASSSTG
jgi:hypothetical protein